MPRIDPSSVKLVDGFKIRQTLDPDFSTMHCHSTAINKYYIPKYYIPEGEWWLDARLKDEKEFFVRAESIDRPRNVKTGTPFKVYLKNQLLKKGKIPNYIVRQEWHFGYRLMMVDGSVIRQYVDPEFTQGGHDLVYFYIPRNQIWIEKALDSEEVLFTLHHERIERKLMLKGKNYDTAHEYATAAEKDVRRAAGGFYPTDDRNPWSKLTDDQIRKKYYVR